MIPDSPADARTRYADLEAQYRTLFEKAKARSFRLGTLRAATFLAACAALLVWDVAQGAASAAALAVGSALIVLFLVEVVVHRRARRDQEWHHTLQGVAHDGVLRLDRAWEELDTHLPARETRPLQVPSGHAYAHDLAVQGRASLARLFGPITTEPGRRTLLGWLLEPAEPDVASARSEAARELRGALDDRMALSALGRLAPAEDPQAVDRFLSWAEAEPWTLGQAAVRLMSWALPTLLVGGVAADVFLHAPPLWVLPLVPQIWLLKRFTGRLAADFKSVELMAPALAAYVPQLRHVAPWPLESPLLKGTGEALRSGGAPAHQRLARLAKLVDSVSSRRNLVYASFAPILLLDIHIGVRLDRWRHTHGEHVRGWLSALGELEAMCGIASLSMDHPDWAFPDWQSEGPPRVEFRGVGHPLLRDASCVRNDVEVGPPGTFLLVTGSNMSGKSTLLRSIGSNIVLAGVGAPVCAGEMSLPRLRVYTSMSIEDSLSEGVSLFMAQLLRVRSIVDSARATGPEDPPVFYLLDEMLHGTNSAERRIAAQAVLHHLLEQGALGAVSTHDLALADAADLATVAVPVHFRETVHRDDGRTRLDFDYLMRAGPAQTSNALALLEAVGLDSPSRTATTPTDTE